MAPSEVLPSVSSGYLNISGNFKTLALSLRKTECVLERQTMLNQRGDVRILLVRVFIPGSKVFPLLLLIFQIDRDHIGIPNRMTDHLVRRAFFFFSFKGKR